MHTRCRPNAEWTHTNHLRHTANWSTSVLPCCLTHSLPETKVPEQVQTVRQSDKYFPIRTGSADIRSDLDQDAKDRLASVRQFGDGESIIRDSTVHSTTVHPNGR